MSQRSVIHCLSYENVDVHFHLILHISLCSHLAQNTCVCKADEKTFHLPLLNHFLPGVWAQNLQKAYLENHPDPESVKRRRAQEYDKFKIR